jgi:nucleoid DNA-binding protein
MKPKKPSSLYKEVSEQLNVDESLIEDIVEYTYKVLRSNLSNLTHARINMDGLGHFVAKRNLVKKYISRSQKLLEKQDTSTFGAYSKKIRIEDKIKLLTEINEKIDAEDTRKKEFKKLKDENSTKDNLGE